MRGKYRRKARFYPQNDKNSLIKTSFYLPAACMCLFMFVAISFCASQIHDMDEDVYALREYKSRTIPFIAEFNKKYDTDWLDVVANKSYNPDYRVEIRELFQNEFRSKFGPFCFGRRYLAVTGDIDEEIRASELEFWKNFLPYVCLIGGVFIWSALMFMSRWNPTPDNSPYLCAKRRRETRKRLAARYRDNAMDY